MIYLLVFIIGLVLGSFASVLIYRLHSGAKGILLGRSKCPKCKTKLGVFDLIPVFSYLLGKGKCRYCNKRIAPVYPSLELIMGSMFVLTSVLVGFGDILQIIFYLFIVFVFVVLSFYDFLFQEVADEVVLPTAIIAFLYMLFTSAYSITNLGIAITVPALFFGIMFFGSGGRWIGGGDIRIGILMGAVLGWPYILIGLFLGYFLGAIFSLIGLMAGLFARKSQIPFAPFLLLGTYIAMFWGRDLLNWYLGVL